MSMHDNMQHEKVKVTFECTIDERAYIKMLSARQHQTISEFLLSYVKKDFPPEINEPNEETTRALSDSRNKKNLGHAKTLGDFWEQMGVKRRA